MVTFANRGVWAEKRVKTYLESWTDGSPLREANRLPDSKSAGRIVKAAPADFEYFVKASGEAHHGLIEVKETKHTHRLDRDRLTQLPRMRKRDKCGGVCLVLVYHSTLEKWRCVYVSWLASNGDKGSWDLHEFPLFDTCAEALAWAVPDVFC